MKEITYLEREDIKENLVVIKINRSYKEGMSADELYEVTRGKWKRRIETVQGIKYGLAVCNSIVVEVYKIDSWAEATPDYSDGFKYYPSRYGRIEFTGEVAPEEIREKYIGKSVAHLYKYGEANPVKSFFVNS